MSKEFDLIDFITSQTTPKKFSGGGSVQGFNGRGSSLVTSAPPTGRTAGASSGFDMVDGIPVPEDRSVRRFDGDEFVSLGGFGNSPFVSSLGGYDSRGIAYTFGDSSGGNRATALKNVYNAVDNMFGGDASTASVNQAVAGSLPIGTPQANAAAAVDKDATPTGVAALLDDASTLTEAADILAAAALQAGVTDPTQLSQIVASGLAAVQSGGNGTAAVAAAMGTAESNGALAAIGDKATQVVEKAAVLLDKVASVKIPGLYDIPGVGGAIEGVVEGGLGAIASVVDRVLGGLGTKNTVVLGPGGVLVKVEAPNTPSTGGQTGSGPTGTANNTTVVIGGPAGTILTGGTLGNIGDKTEGVFTELPDSATLADLVLMGACHTRGGTYDPNTKICTENSTTKVDPCIAMRTTCAQTNEVPNVACTGCVGKAKSEDTSAGSTTVTIGGPSTGGITKPAGGVGAIIDCTNRKYAFDNPIKCASTWQNCKDGTWILATETCPESKKDKIICPDEYVNAKQEVDDIADCGGLKTTTPKTIKCPDNYVLAGEEKASLADCGGLKTTTPKTIKCPDNYVLAGEEKASLADCGGLKTAALCPDETKLAGKPIPADGNCDPAGILTPCEEMKAECAKLGKEMKEDCSGCADTAIPPPPGGVSTPELPSFIPQSALNVIRQEKPELVNIDYLYDIGGDSIFAPNLQGLDEDGSVGPALDGNPYRTSAKKGGMIRNQNAVDAIVELLKGK